MRIGTWFSDLSGPAETTRLSGSRSKPLEFPDP
jgi:hypothetical protein